MARVRRAPPVAAILALAAAAAGVGVLGGPSARVAVGATTGPPRASAVPVVEDVALLGDATAHGSTASVTGNRPLVGLASTPSGGGYWLVANDGGVFSFGDAAFHGSTGALRLNQPIVGMVPTPSGGGYWLVASDGGVFSFGDAAFHGSTGNLVLNQPVVGAATTPTGGGYWLVASDGGVFAFGDAPFLGSFGTSPTSSQPVVAIATRPTGDGYWLVSYDGSVEEYGAAPALGDLVGAVVTTPLTGAVSTPSGNGLVVAGSGTTLVHLLHGEELAATRRDARPAPVFDTTVEDLLAGPTPFEGYLGYTSAIPTGTTLLGLDVVGDLATVDLSGQFATGGGSLSMRARVAQMVFTLTALPGVERVAFRLDGVPVVAIGGEGVLVDPPVTRETFADFLPDILVETPAPGQVVNGPLVVTGISDTFEGNVLLLLSDDTGAPLAFTFTTGGAMGARPFGVSLAYQSGVSFGGTLTVWWPSPEDGRPLGVANIPVRFRP